MITVTGARHFGSYLQREVAETDENFGKTIRVRMEEKQRKGRGERSPTSLSVRVTSLLRRHSTWPQQSGIYLPNRAVARLRCS